MFPSFVYRVSPFLKVEFHYILGQDPKTTAYLILTLDLSDCPSVLRDKISIRAVLFLGKYVGVIDSC